MLIDFFNAIAYTGVFVLGLVLLLGFLAKLGPPGKKLRQASTRAPMLDVIFSLISWIPWVFCGLFFGWVGVAGAIIAQLCVIQIWIFGHEAVHPKARRGPRIVRYLDHRVGWLNNRAALWVTVGAFPIFWFVRFAQILLYPFLVRLVNFPRYDHGDWVNLTRHRFRGLVGHDLLWCLYCDWMTGVYCFGAEMLRNVETFWCPIQFDDKIKRENCKQDFPDVEGVWVPPGSTMEDVDAVMHRLYDEGNMSWGGHPSRGRDEATGAEAGGVGVGAAELAEPVPLPLDEPPAPHDQESPPDDDEPRDVESRIDEPDHDQPRKPDDA